MIYTMKHESTNIKICPLCLTVCMMNVLILPFLRYNTQVAYIQTCTLWEQQTAATMGEMMSAGGMYAGKPFGKPRREINHNFMTDFRENAFESADMCEFRIDFKSRFPLLKLWLSLSAYYLPETQYKSLQTLLHVYGISTCDIR